MTKQMTVTTGFTRKSLHRQLEEAAKAKNVTIEVTPLDDGRIGYTLTQHGVELLPVTPGEAARMLGVEWNG